MIEEDTFIVSVVDCIMVKYVKIVSINTNPHVQLDLFNTLSERICQAQMFDSIYNMDLHNLKTRFVCKKRYNFAIYCDVAIRVIT